MMRRLRILSNLAALLVTATTSAAEPAPDPAAVERGRIALTQTGHLRPAWKSETYFDVARLWGVPHPDPKADPAGYAAAFNRRYGLHPAPYPNDGLPMGLRRGVTQDGRKAGMQIDCMACHGGSIGGTSYVGLGNSTLDLKLLFDELTQSEGRMRPIATFTLNSTRGTVNAGQVAAVLMSFHNPDWSRRVIPLPLGANLPEMDTPAWWLLHRKQTMYYDGRTPAESVRTNIQFVMGEKSLDELKALEPVFADVRAYLLSLRPPKYPFTIDAARAERGKAVFIKSCKKCHGTYGSDGEYPNVYVDLKEIGTDPARAEGMSREARRALQLDLVRRAASGRPGDEGLPGSSAGWHLGDGPLPPQRLGADAARAAQVDRASEGLPPPGVDRLQGLRPGERRLDRRAALGRAGRVEDARDRGEVHLRCEPVRAGQRGAYLW